MLVRKPPAGIQLRVRRNVDDLSNLDVERLRSAFGAAMKVSDKRGYQHWAGIHGLPSYLNRNQKPEFLPWNRLYLLHFEAALRSFEPGATLPWWDWSAARSNEHGIPGAYASPTAEGAPNPLYAAEIHIQAADQQGEKIPDKTYRRPGPPDRLPSEADLERVLALDTFEDFSLALEVLHNGIHGWVGGTNGMVALSSYDPFSWAYQASVDRIWWLWQQDHPAQEAPQSIATQSLAPFSTTVGEAWDTTLLGYGYGDSTPRSRQSLPGATSDRPATADQLNFSDYAQAFAEIISSPHTTPPLTIGIYGSWGIGKSSLLEMIADQFRKPPKKRKHWWNHDPSPSDERPSVDSSKKKVDVHVVEFNAWEYSANDKIWPALVRVIMERMEEAAQWSPRTRLGDTLKRNLERNWRQHGSRVIVALGLLVPLAALAAWQLDFDASLILAALLAVGIPGLVKLGADTITNPVSRWVGELVERDGYGDELSYMREIHDDLRFLTEQMGGDQRAAAASSASGESSKPGPRVLVTIDDLDRCEPEKAVEVLQAINLLLDFRVFVICLGIDARVITAAVEAHYKELLGSAGASGYEYLDKIVQIPFRIPTPRTLEIERFLESQMPERPPSEPNHDHNRVAAERTAAGFDTRTRYPSSPSNPPESSEPEKTEQPIASPTMFDRDEIQGFQELAPFIRRNPRHIKRLINVYRMVRTLAARRGVDEILDNPQLTAAWIVICAQWPYTVGAMLEVFEEIAEAVDGGAQYPTGEPLPELYERAAGRLSAERQRQIDDSIEDLERLLGETKMQWAELRTVQPYTLNFNPAIEEALRNAPATAEPLESSKPAS